MSSRCGSYGPGHHMHWIHGNKSHEPDQPIIKVRVTAVHDDGRIDIAGRDLALTLWHHDPQAMAEAQRFGGYAEWLPKWHVLYMVSIGGFNVATPGRIAACQPPLRRRPGETTRQLLDRAVRDHHGITIPARWLTDLDATPEDTDPHPRKGTP
ncbi:hypothetical protein [Mycobacterium sp. 1274756.6]|uniref:hypothetical protein n=1 Tax=Mycobacterium sp. 1274756.6 TaxID=1834076 RepID=UPI000B09174A|nr:hypothetical protein [Mycobacterium sp. 1274756.6]